VDGSFGGIVVALVNVRSLTHYIQSIELGRKTKVALMMNNSDTLVGMDGGTDKEMLKIWMEQRKKLASSLQQKKETQ
jgi:hypothetical protein